MTDLSDALASLIDPVFRKVIQDNPEGPQPTKVVTVEDVPLLEQLEASIRVSFGSDGGSSTSSPGNERNVVDSGALFEFGKIATEVTDWCRTRKVTPTRNPMVDLRAWHAARTEEHAERDAYYMRRLYTWAAMIEGKLRPKKRLEITEPCPICGSDRWTDEDGAVMKLPVIVEFEPDALGMLNSATATCRNTECGHVWSGERELRQLRWDLDAKTG